jgi:site-specific recombinase XerD
MAEPEINTFLTHLAVERHVSASTQNQALSALLFLYRHVLGRDVGQLVDVVRARKPARLSVVMSRDEGSAVFKHLSGEHFLMALLMYGSGLRLLECLRLRVQDIDFESRLITVRDGKRFKDRVTMLPAAAVQPLERHLEHVRRLHRKDLDEGPEGCSCRMHTSECIPTPRWSGGGSGSSRRNAGGGIGQPAARAVTMSTNQSFSERFARPS